MNTILYPSVNFILGSAPIVAICPVLGQYNTSTMEPLGDQFACKDHGTICIQNFLPLCNKNQNGLYFVDKYSTKRLYTVKAVISKLFAGAV